MSEKKFEAPARGLAAPHAQAEPVGEVVMYPNYSTVVHWNPVMPPSGTKLYAAPVPQEAEQAAPAAVTDEQALFEAWLRKNDPRPFEPDAYWEHAYKWRAWQAARADRAAFANRIWDEAVAYGRDNPATKVRTDRAPAAPAVTEAEQKCTGCDPAEGFCKDCREAEQASVLAARAAALEEAAQACTPGLIANATAYEIAAIRNCAAAIRALINPATTKG